MNRFFFFVVFILDKVHLLRLLYFSLSFTVRFKVQYKDGIWLEGQSFTWVVFAFFSSYWWGRL